MRQKNYKKKSKKGDDIEEMRKTENLLNRKAKESNATNEDKQKACETIRMYNYKVKLKQERDLTKLSQDQEKVYKKRLLDNCTRCDQRNIWKTEIKTRI